MPDRCRVCRRPLTVLPGVGVYAPLGLCGLCRLRARAWADRTVREERRRPSVAVGSADQLKG